MVEVIAGIGLAMAGVIILIMACYAIGTFLFRHIIGAIETICFFAILAFAGMDWAYLVLVASLALNLILWLARKIRYQKTVIAARKQKADLYEQVKHPGKNQTVSNAELVKPVLKPFTACMTSLKDHMFQVISVLAFVAALKISSELASVVLIMALAGNIVYFIAMAVQKKN